MSLEATVCVCGTRIRVHTPTHPRPRPRTHTHTGFDLLLEALDGVTRPHAKFDVFKVRRIEVLDKDLLCVGGCGCGCGCGCGSGSGWV